MTHLKPDRLALQESIALSRLPKVTCGAFRTRVEQHGSAAAAFRAFGSSQETAEALRSALEVISLADSAGATILIQREPEYPEPLLDLSDAPSFLYALGDRRLTGRRRVGIVGTRHSSTSGDRIAYQMAASLVRAGAVVVSGMAFGIDAAAHRGALDAGGGTIAVLGGGVDVPYPPSHAALHDRIRNEGLVVSEAPIGSRPTKGAFPKRNRIIAALSETLIVVEAGHRSGALITSRLALDLGRNVAAVPGPIDSPRHVGSNWLLSEGAAFISNVDDVLSIAGIEPVNENASSHEVVPTEAQTHDDPAQAKILEAVRAGASDIEDLARSTKMSPRDFASALSTLEVAGRLVVTPTGGVALSTRLECLGSRRVRIGSDAKSPITMASNPINGTGALVGDRWYFIIGAP